jgi:hypothetical protein
METTHAPAGDRVSLKRLVQQRRGSRSPAGLNASDAREAIFGSFDGMTSTLGVMAVATLIGSVLLAIPS